MCGYLQRPSAQVGRTTFIADDRGHLLPGVGKVRSHLSSFPSLLEVTFFTVNIWLHSLTACVLLQRGLAWPDFKGTWDLPARIPGQRINPTARSVEGLNRLKSWGRYPKNADMSQPHRGSKSTNRQKETGEQVRATQTQQPGVVLSLEFFHPDWCFHKLCAVFTVCLSVIWLTQKKLLSTASSFQVNVMFELNLETAWAGFSEDYLYF